MAHLRSSSYYQDSHDDYGSSSSSHRQPYHSLHAPKQERRGRPAYTTVRPFIINSRNNPIARPHDTISHDLNRQVGSYVANRLVPTMLRSSDRPVEVFMNFGDAKLSLPDHDDHIREPRSGASSRGPNSIIFNAPGCSLTIDGRRCDRYCHRCDPLDREHHDRDRHHHLRRRNMELDHELDDRHHHLRRDNNGRSRSHVRITSHSGNPSPSPLPPPNRDQHYHLDRGLDLNHGGGHHDRHPHSRSHIRVVSHSRNPSPSPLPLPGLFPIATAVEKASHSTRGGRGHGNGISHALCPGCLIKTTVYKDGYCADCHPPTYTPNSRRVETAPISGERGHGTRVRYTRDQVTGDGSSSEDGWASVEVASRAIDMERGTNRGRDRGGVYDVITNGGGYGRSGMRTSRRLKPRYSGYASESDL